MGSITFFVLFIILVVIPAYYINKWMLKITKPKESFRRLGLYVLLSIAIALAYSAIFIFIVLSIYPLPKK